MEKVVDYSTKLEKLNRSAFPVAVRQTLNDAAFTTKQLVPKIADQKFTVRQRNFFRAFSTVIKAQGFDVGRMVAIAGINTTKGDEVAEGLEQQEIGGTITGRKLIPHNKGRISGSYGKKLRARHRFQNINISTPKNKKPSSKYLLIKKGGKGTVFHIKRLKTKNKLTPIYTYRNTKKSRVQKRPFMRPAAMMAASKLPQFYVKHAQRQFERILK